jgi:hypothetical protein
MTDHDPDEDITAEEFDRRFEQGTPATIAAGQTIVHALDQHGQEIR